MNATDQPAAGSSLMPRGPQARPVRHAHRLQRLSPDDRHPRPGRDLRPRAPPRAELQLPSRRGGRSLRAKLRSRADARDPLHLELPGSVRPGQPRRPQRGRGVLAGGRPQAPDRHRLRSIRARERGGQPRPISSTAACSTTGRSTTRCRRSWSARPSTRSIAGCCSSSRTPSRRRRRRRVPARPHLAQTARAALISIPSQQPIADALLDLAGHNQRRRADQAPDPGP